jgi:hypothetical protein
VTGRTLGTLAALALASACRGDGAGTAQASTVERAPDAAVQVAPPPDAMPAVAVPARPEHDAWHLGANRHLAHLVIDGDLVIDAGAPGFARYTRFGLPVERWGHATIDGEPVAVPREKAKLDLPLTDEQAASATTLRMKVHSDGPATLTVSLGGKKVARTMLPGGWQELAFAARFKAGENLLALDTKDVVHVRWIAAAATELEDPLARASWRGAAGGFVLDGGAGLAWYLQLPGGGRGPAPGRSLAGAPDPRLSRRRTPGEGLPGVPRGTRPARGGPRHRPRSGAPGGARGAAPRR